MTYSLAPISLTASTTITRSHANAPLVLNAAAGMTLTLPASAGIGDVYDFVVGTTVTSNSVVIKVANATDIIRGNAVSLADGGNTVNGWETAADTDTITLDGTTTGGIRGDRIRLVDAVSGIWMVQFLGSATGTEATPFSATVS